MGIKRLRNTLLEKCTGTGVLRFNSFQDFIKNEKKRLGFRGPYFVGIDAYLYANRYKRVCQRIEYAFFTQIIQSLSIGIIPIYIFDGRAPEQKRKTIKKRENERNRNWEKLQQMLVTCKVNLNDLIKTDRHGYFIYDQPNTSEQNQLIIKLFKKSIRLDHSDISNVKSFLDFLKIPYILAKGEADDVMADLYRAGIIHACQSDDMDMLPKGCGNVIQIAKKTVTQFLLPEILRGVRMSYVEFVDYCILLGSDYYSSYALKMKPNDMYNIFIQNPSIELFIQSFSKTDPKVLNHLENYKKIRYFFLTEYPAEQFIYDPTIICLKTINRYFREKQIVLNKDDQRKILPIIRKINLFISSLMR